MQLSNTHKTILIILLLQLFLSRDAFAFDWSITEFQSNFGVISTPSFAGGGKNTTIVATIEHSDGWRYGDNYFFIDFAESTSPIYNDNDIYAEYYANFSFDKIFQKKISSGLLNDLGFIIGVNWAKNAKVIKYLPGIRFALNLPGFAFSNLDFTAYLDASKGVQRGGAPKQKESFMVDFNWSYPFTVKGNDFAITGHLEYIKKRFDSFGNRLASHVLNQEQIRWDIGKAINGTPNKFFLGLEISIWINKLGDTTTNEFAPQALIAYRF
jgi:hypothetical protein